MNVFHLTWYPGEPLRRINREGLGERLSQYGRYVAVNFDRSGFRSRWPEYPEKKNKRMQL
jgi:hypothetical protein